LWGQGKAPVLKKLTERFKLKGSVITAVDLLKGIGKYAGLKPIAVKGATGFIDTNYAGKVSAGLKALEKEDLLILHIEAPDECGHMGNAKLKIKAIEDFDSKVVRPIVAGLQKRKEAFRVMILPDHPTPVALKTHSGEPVPFVFYDSVYERAGLHGTYCEKTAKSSGIVIPQGCTLVEKLIHARF
jgi:2,3-bisphosphoglycerate-independent phosphoglycerate mutase